MKTTHDRKIDST